jgi:hypothetical protein
MINVANGTDIHMYFISCKFLFSHTVFLSLNEK